MLASLGGLVTWEAAMCAANDHMRSGSTIFLVSKSIYPPDVVPAGDGYDTLLITFLHNLKGAVDTNTIVDTIFNTNFLLEMLAVTLCFKRLSYRCCLYQTSHVRLYTDHQHIILSHGGLCFYMQLVLPTCKTPPLNPDHASHVRVLRLASP
jgi:hypothetical protein